MGWGGGGASGERGALEGRSFPLVIDFFQVRIQAKRM